MKPIVDGLETDYGQQIDFVYLNIDDDATLEARQTYGFRFQPHFILVNADGEVVEEWLGYTSANVFEESFANILAQ